MPESIDVSPATESPGLYIHVPFCRSICPYCDFAVTLGDAEKQNAFCDGLLAEIELVGQSGAWSAFDTIYFGGGTPSVLTPSRLEGLVASLQARLPIASDVSIHLEANPEDVSPAGVAAWRELGVRFLSLGVQSFDEARLEFLGRAHDGLGARRAVAWALEGGIDTVSLDLIFGLPDSDPEAWGRDLDAAIELEIDHLSCYQLTIHCGTAFGSRRARGELAELDRDRQADLYAMTHDRLGGAGFEGYEVSSFARSPEHRSAHNEKYWRHVPYLGLGPSAHSFDGRRRWWNRRGLGSWERAVTAGERPVAEIETLTPAQLVLERVMLGLRTRRGVDLRALEERYGCAVLDPNRERLERLAGEGLVVVENGRLAPTRAGMAVADGLARQLEVGNMGPQEEGSQPDLPTPSLPPGRMSLNLLRYPGAPLLNVVTTTLPVLAPGSLASPATYDPAPRDRVRRSG